MTLLTCLNLNNAEDCRTLLELWYKSDKKEIFWNPEYIKLFSKESEEPICLVWKESEAIIALPLIKRSISDFLTVKDTLKLFDAISPYGYGGPYYEGFPNWSFFWKEFIRWAKEEMIVSCFIRLDLFLPKSTTDGLNIKIKSKNIVRNLDIDEMDLWYDYEHKVRKNVKRAKSEKVFVEVDNDGLSIDKYINIYYETMKRRNADEYYYFSQDWFRKFIKVLRGKYLIFNAFYRDEIISTELVLVSNENIYSFLGGTKENYFYLRPNDLLKHEIILWGIRQKKKRYILGGGYNGEDGIYKYKKSFAPNGITDYKVAEIIFDNNMYEKLIEIRAKEEYIKGRNWKPRQDYFPAYRS